MLRTLLTVCGTIAVLVSMGCTKLGSPPKITQPYKIAGNKEITAAKLEHGREKYTLYCRACHGDKGDGRGPAGIGMRPPPRNFTDPIFKFGGVEAGQLPPDDELKRIVKGGLTGTPMLPWEVPDEDLDDIVAYIKTFSDIWVDEEPGAKVEISEDPWKGKEAEAITRGKVVYHGSAQCLKCHPAYATKQEIWDATKEMTGEGSTSAFREGMYFPEAKMAEKFGNKLLPPDFLRHPIKSGSTPHDLFRTIASGIGGTAMPMWKGSLEDQDIWAIAHFVNNLYAMRDKPEAHKLHDALVNQPEWTAPEPAPPPPEVPPAKPGSKPVK